MCHPPIPQIRHWIRAADIVFVIIGVISSMTSVIGLQRADFRKLVYLCVWSVECCIGSHICSHIGSHIESHIDSHIYVRRYRLEHFTFTQTRTLPPHGNGSLRSIYINTGIEAWVIRGHNKVMFTISTNDVFLAQNRHRINVGTLLVCSMSNNILFVERACVHALTDPIPCWPTWLFRLNVAWVNLPRAGYIISTLHLF